MMEISKRENFYQQECCGRAYSLRDTNLVHIFRGGEPLQMGEKFYGMK